MSGCPACGRPVALARARCLYCGRELPRDLVAPPIPPAHDGPGAPSVADAADAPAAPRVLLVLDLAGTSPSVLERALSLSTYEATLRARRGGLHLQGVFDEAAAAHELERLRSQGLLVEPIPEKEARVRPLAATGGERRGDRMDLRTEQGTLALAAEDLLIVVRGPIARQHQPSDRPRKLVSAAPEEGHRVHLHRRTDPRPVEIDPANFEFGFAPTGSPRLEIDAWLSSLGDRVTHDDGFRWLPPAFGIAPVEPRTALSAVGRLAGGGRQSSGTTGGPVVLDNTAQFRFYSGWRAAIERRRAAPSGA